MENTAYLIILVSDLSRMKEDSSCDGRWVAQCDQFNICDVITPEAEVSS